MARQPDKPTRAERQAAQDYRDEMAIRQLRDINAKQLAEERAAKDDKDT